MRSSEDKKKYNREYSKKHYLKNRNKYLKRSKAWRKAHPLKMRRLSREFVWKRNGWTPEKYKIASIAQDNLCAICRKKPKGRLFGDHDHDTKISRGLLCRRCNAGIGFLQDSSLVLELAAAYLRKYGK